MHYISIAYNCSSTSTRDMVNRLQHCRSNISCGNSWTSKSRLTVSDKLLGILCRREMSHAFHRLVLTTRDFVAGSLTHGWRIAPVIFTRQHVDGALLCVCECSSQLVIHPRDPTLPRIAPPRIAPVNIEDRMYSVHCLRLDRGNMGKPTHDLPISFILVRPSQPPKYMSRSP